MPRRRKLADEVTRGSLVVNQSWNTATTLHSGRFVENLFLFMKSLFPQICHCEVWIGTTSEYYYVLQDNCKCFIRSTEFDKNFLKSSRFSTNYKNFIKIVFGQFVVNIDFFILEIIFRTENPKKHASMQFYWSVENTVHYEKVFIKFRWPDENVKTGVSRCIMSSLCFKSSRPWKAGTLPLGSVN